MAPLGEPHSIAFCNSCGSIGAPPLLRSLIRPMEEGRGADYHLRQEAEWECQMEVVQLRFPHLRTRAELDRAWRETFGKARGKGQGDKGHKGKGKGKEAHWFSSPAAQQLTSLAAHQDRKSTRLNSSHSSVSRMPSSA